MHAPPKIPSTRRLSISQSCGQSAIPPPVLYPRFPIPSPASPSPLNPSRRIIPVPVRRGRPTWHSHACVLPAKWHPYGRFFSSPPISSAPPPPPRLLLLHCFRFCICFLMRGVILLRYEEDAMAGHRSTAAATGGRLYGQVGVKRRVVEETAAAVEVGGGGGGYLGVEAAVLLGVVTATLLVLPLLLPPLPPPPPMLLLVPVAIFAVLLLLVLLPSDAKSIAAAGRPSSSSSSSYL
ncbi:hypothetical protein DAI22_08g010601 [Oryza sativa Japonica Group]|nr:hypothetical protein DAI22_08g010601 [Oryza sativa Japonica Group]